MRPENFHVILFDSVSSTLLAEKILKNHAIPHKVIPVPRHISSDCGVCIRAASRQLQQIESILKARVNVQGTCPLER